MLSSATLLFTVRSEGMGSEVSARDVTASSRPSFDSFVKQFAKGSQWLVN